MHDDISRVLQILPFASEVRWFFQVDLHEGSCDLHKGSCGLQEDHVTCMRDHVTLSYDLHEGSCDCRIMHDLCERYHATVYSVYVSMYCVAACKLP